MNKKRRQIVGKYLDHKNRSVSSKKSRQKIYKKIKGKNLEVEKRLEIHLKMYVHGNIKGLALQIMPYQIQWESY